MEKETLSTKVTIIDMTGEFTSINKLESNSVVKTTKADMYNQNFDEVDNINLDAGTIVSNKETNNNKVRLL